MNLKIEQTASLAIVYDADCLQQPAPELFDVDYWRRTGSVCQIAPGRGNALMLDTAFGPLVMRPYLRGGWAAHISRDRYLFTGFERSRSVAEVRMLAQLIRLGLPAPRPVAGQCLRHGLTYTAVLLTRRIFPAHSLAELVQQDAKKEPDWLQTGRCIRRFHDAGVIHPDLNARNILYGEHGGRQGDIHLVDFDRAFFRQGARYLFRSNLRRLRRSLQKFWPDGREGELQACWEQLMSGYNGGK